MLKIPLNIPNILSLYRLLSMPFILFFIWLGYYNLFVILFTVNQITDILDGYIARKYKLQTDIGARLDSYADIGSYIIALYAIIKWHPYLFTNYGYWLITFITLYVLQLCICWLRHKKWVAGLHLYSSKITGYVQGIFLLILFIFGFINWLFYFMIAIGISAELEAIVINLTFRTPVINAKGLYWVLKNRKEL